MVTLKGNHIYLRALELEDLDFIYNIENDTELWELSHTQTPYSKFILKQYLSNAHLDIFEAKQLRLAICKADSTLLGLIDVYDFDAKNKRAGIGILIYDTMNRSKGFGKEALNLLVEYCFTSLHLHQVYANVSEDNTSSINLFKTNGFEITGLKKDWNFNGDTFSNEYLLQRIKL